MLNKTAVVQDDKKVSTQLVQSAKALGKIVLATKQAGTQFDFKNLEGQIYEILAKNISKIAEADTKIETVYSGEEDDEPYEIVIDENNKENYQQFFLNYYQGLEAYFNQNFGTKIDSKKLNNFLQTLPYAGNITDKNTLVAVVIELTTTALNLEERLKKQIKFSESIPAQVMITMKNIGNFKRYSVPLPVNGSENLSQEKELGLLHMFEKLSL